MVVEVRLATPADAAVIADIHVRAWQAAYRGLMPDEVLDLLSVEQREQSWRQALTDGGGLVVYVAVKRRAVVGFCAVAAPAPARDDDEDDRVAEVGAIYVDPDVWRRGVGRALMDVAMQELRADGWRWMTLWVLPGNTPARDFYARCGFEPDGAETTHESSGEQVIRMRRPVTT